MARQRSRPSHYGPYIRPLDVPDQDVPLRPAQLRPGRRFPRLPRSVYGTALAAWTIGLLAASLGLLHDSGARSSGGTGASARAASEPVLPVPPPALPVGSETFKNTARP